MTQKIADGISQHLHNLPKFDGLALKYIAASNGRFRQSSAVTVGGGVDSYYEYLLKQWIQTGKTRNWQVLVCVMINVTFYYLFICVL